MPFLNSADKNVLRSDVNVKEASHVLLQSLRLKEASEELQVYFLLPPQG